MLKKKNIDKQNRINEKSFDEWFAYNSVFLQNNGNKTFISERKSYTDLSNINNDTFISNYSSLIIISFYLIY